MAPVIEISARRDGDLLLVTVADNGTGTAAKVISLACGFSMVACDKTAYCGPTRCAQGITLKTIIGIPHAL